MADPLETDAHNLLCEHNSALNETLHSAAESFNYFDKKPTLLNLAPDQQELLAQFVMANYDRWKLARAPLENKWQECWQAYLCDVPALYTEPDEPSLDRSRVARPVLYEAVEAIHSNLLNAMFPADARFFSVIGNTEEDHQNIPIIEEFLRTKLENINFSEKYSTFLKQAIITGSSVAAVPWIKEIKTKKINQPVKILGIPIGTQKLIITELTKNRPDFDVVDMFDFLLDPDEPDFQKSTLIRRVERSLHELKKSGAYNNLENLEQTSDAHKTLTDSKKQSRREVFGLQSVEGTKNRLTEQANPTIILYEAWGDFWIGEEVFENYVCVIANGRRVIRFEPNPYDSGLKPFVFTTFISVPNEIYGIGAIEKSLGLQHAINTLTNQKLDVINISINNPFTYLINDDVFDPDTVITRPGALIPVKSHETLRPIQYLNNFTVAFNEISDLKNEIQEATGAFKYFTGGEGARNTSKTATEVSALIQGGNQKFSNFIAHLEHTSLEPFLLMIFENAKQFLLEPETVRIAQEDGSLKFQKILPDLLQTASCSFKINGSQSVVLKGQELDALMMFLKLVEQNPNLTSQVNTLELYKRIYRRLGFKDEDSIFIQQK